MKKLLFLVCLLMIWGCTTVEIDFDGFDWKITKKDIENNPAIETLIIRVRDAMKEFNNQFPRKLYRIHYVSRKGQVYIHLGIVAEKK